MVEKVKDQYSVWLFNDNHHSFEDVIFILESALHYDRIRSEQLAIITNNCGQSKLYTGNKNTAIKYGYVLSKAGLHIKVRREGYGNKN